MARRRSPRAGSRRSESPISRASQPLSWSEKYAAPRAPHSRATSSQPTGSRSQPVEPDEEGRQRHHRDERVEQGPTKGRGPIAWSSSLCKAQTKVAQTAPTRRVAPATSDQCRRRSDRSVRIRPQTAPTRDGGVAAARSRVVAAVVTPFRLPAVRSSGRGVGCCHDTRSHPVRVTIRRGARRTFRA